MLNYDFVNRHALIKHMCIHGIYLLPDDVTDLPQFVQKCALLARFSPQCWQYIVTET